MHSLLQDSDERFLALLGLFEPAEQKVMQRAYHLIKHRWPTTITASGFNYVEHSLSVANIVAIEMGLGSTAVVGALLQDIAVAEGMDELMVEQQFGPEIARIATGLRTISLLRTEKVSFHSENFIRLLLAIAGDSRVILIKLADRLHFMRQLEFLRESDKARISVETSKLYAPMAHRLGLYNIKTELEELSMRYTEPAIYFSIDRKLQDSREKLDVYVAEFSRVIGKELSKDHLRFEIKGRTKSIFSIWNKMKAQNVDFDEVFDVFAIRIILESKPENEKSDCWKAYSVVTNLFQPNPKRLRDWITKPKENGYESLHTTVMGPENRWVEVQIRTQRMDDEAEKGHAAHWLYKGAKGNDPSLMVNIRHVLERADPTEDAEHLHKIKIADDSIFVFTPQGDLKKLPKGASVLDFAFEIHTGLGEKCTGARVNGVQVQIKHVLKNGDKVEVITSKNQKPNLDWLNWVATNRARNKIKRFLRVAEFNRSEEGREILRRKLNQMDLTLSDTVLNKLFAHYKLAEPLELYHYIAAGRIDISEIKEVVQAPSKSVDEALKEKIQKKIQTRSFQGKPGADFLLIDNNPEISDFTLSKCCQPVSGDAIFGFVTVGAGIKIHRADCHNANQMQTRYPYRVLEAIWVKKEEITSFIADIRIAGNDRHGIVSDITQAVSQDSKISLRSIQVDSKMGKFEGMLRVMVTDSKHLDSLLHRLVNIAGVKKASRVQIT